MLILKRGGFRVTSDTRFDLASVTKIIVETAFLALVDAGKAALDDPLHAVIPEFAAANPRAIGGSQDPAYGRHAAARRRDSRRERRCQASHNSFTC